MDIYLLERKACGFIYIKKTVIDIEDYGSIDDGPFLWAYSTRGIENGVEELRK